MKKLRKIFVSVVLSGCLGLLLTSAWVVFNPVTAYAWECCTAHCQQFPCSYNVTCCGAYCVAGDGVGCTSYYADGELYLCKQCYYNQQCRPYFCE